MVQMVAVDGGGSRCRLAAMLSDGSIVAHITVEQPASLSASVEGAWIHIQSGLESLRRQLGLAADWWPDLLAMGLAGSLRVNRRQAFLALIPSRITTILVTDGAAQLAGTHAGEPGACLAVGTGSVLHWKDHEGQAGMAGGWGYPAGDQGSGAWLGMRALQHYIAYLDGVENHSLLIEALQEIVGDDISDIQAWTTQVQASVMAQLAPQVFKSAEAGDPVSVALIEQAVQCCLQLLNCAPQELPVCVVGGVGEQLKCKLSDHLGSRLRSSKGDALQGLFLMARQQ